MTIALPARVASASVEWHREKLIASLHGTTVEFPVTDAQDRVLGKKLGDFGHPQRLTLKPFEATVHIVRGGVSVWIGGLSWFRPVKRNLWQQMLDQEQAAREEVACAMA